MKKIKEKDLKQAKEEREQAERDKQRIVKLETEKEELLKATIDLADTVATQSAQLAEQSDALVDLANTVAEVMNNG